MSPSRTILGSTPALLQVLLGGVATAADLGSLGVVSLTIASLAIAANAVSPIAGLIGDAKHEKECGEIRSFVEQMVLQQGDWRKGLEELLARNGLSSAAIDSADRSNPLVQFAVLLTGTQDQIKAMLDGNTRLVVALQRSVETRLPEISRLARLTRADVQQILARQREDTRSLALLQSVLARVEEMVRRRPTLCLPEADLQPGDARGNPFVFSQRFVPLLGREKLLIELHRFLRAPNISAVSNKEKFAWWWMHGEGGCGKSRLAHELCIDARALGWEAGRLEISEPFHDWARWDIDRPTLIVIDYAGDRPDRPDGGPWGPARVIEHLARRASTLPHPVRVLLIDRSRTESLDKQLKEGLASGGASAIGQREHLSDGAMPPLDEADLRSLIGFAHFWFTGDMPDLDRAYAVLRTIDPQPAYFTPTSMGYQWRARPLYACVLGYAISQVGLDKVETWTGDQLLDWVLKEERRHWQAAGVRECHVHAAVLATLTKGLALPVDPASTPFGDLAADGLLPTGEAGELAGAAHMAAFAGGPVRGPSGIAGAMPHLPPITPDLLGERFVLDRLAGELSCDGSTGQTVVRDTRRLICDALRHAPAAALDFVDRAVRDFAHHKQVAQLWTACPDTALPPPTEADLLGKVIQRLFKRGRAQDAFTLMRRLAGLHQAAPADQAVTGPFTDALHTVGSALGVAAQHKSAMQMFQLALDANLRAFGEHDARVAESLNFIGRVLQETGDFRKALDAFQTAERIDRDVYGDNHPIVAVRINNVGSAMQALGNAHGALEKYFEVERIFRSVFGGMHPNVAASLNNVGSAMHALGNAQGALDKYREAERIDRAVYGDLHPSVATRVNNVGTAMHALGDAQAAAACHLEALVILLRTIGPAHPDTAATFMALVELGEHGHNALRRVFPEEIVQGLIERLDSAKRQEGEANAPTPPETPPQH